MRGIAGKGVIFGIADRLSRMVAIMPMTGARLFGMNLGILARMVALVLNIDRVRPSRPYCSLESDSSIRARR